MRRAIKSCLVCIRSLWAALLKPQVPLLFTIVGFLLTVLATVCLVPRIQQEFETNRVRSEFMIRQMDEFSHRNNELFVHLRVYSDLSESESIRLEARRMALSALTSLNWRTVEISIILGQNSALDRYQIAVIGMMDKLEGDYIFIEFLSARRELESATYDLHALLAEAMNRRRFEVNRPVHPSPTPPAL